MTGIPINAKNLQPAARTVAATDPVLASIHDRLGPPPLWLRRPGLSSLLHIILEQQVSLASGRTAMRRLRRSCNGSISARRICLLGPEQLRAEARLTRQKSDYVFSVATACQKRQLNLRALETASDEDVRRQLTAIRGIGPWTANIYLLNALARPDVLPSGDLALVSELQVLCNLADPPDYQWIERRADRWRPLRSVAVRMIWHSYLARRGRTGELQSG